MAKPGIVIVIEGGMVSKVCSEADVNVYIIDRDADDEDHPHWVESRQAYLWKEDVEIDEYAVSDAEKDWEAC